MLQTENKETQTKNNKYNCINNRNIKSENHAQNAKNDIPNKNALVHSILSSEVREQLIARLLPVPAKIVAGEDDFMLNEHSVLRVSVPDKCVANNIAMRLVTMLEAKIGYKLQVEFSESSTIYQLSIGCCNDEHCKIPEGREGYFLEVSSVGIIVAATAQDGLRWGAMTLFQLLISEYGKDIVAGCRIEDVPHYSWRGFMVDAGRAPVSLSALKRIIDICSSFKLNSMIYREGDDELNAVRYRTIPIGSENPHALTIDEIAELAEYGANNGIAVIPEIECLGHSQAKAYHYPELVSGGFVAPMPGSDFTHIRKAHLKPADSVTLNLLKSIISEWLPIQKTDYIHIGMDEIRLPGEKQTEHLDLLLPMMDELGEASGRIIKPIVWGDAPPTPEKWKSRVVRCLWSYAEHNNLGGASLNGSHLLRQGIDELIKEDSVESVIMAGGSGSFARPMGKNGIEVAIENLAHWAKLGKDFKNFIGLLAVQWCGNSLDMWLPDFTAAADFSWNPPTGEIDMTAYDQKLFDHIYGLDSVFPPLNIDTPPIWNGLVVEDGRFVEDLVK